jgi:HK97 family phage prohead protease
MAGDSYPPTAGMVDEAQRGLNWRREFGRGGTAIGIARARDIVNRKDLPIDTWRRIKAYFDRHEIDKQGQGWSSGDDGYPSNGRIAWALWGGDAGWTRAKELISQASASADRNMENVMIEETRDAHGIYPLTPIQIAQIEADHSIVDLFGLYDQGIGEGGSHYSAVSPFADEGLVCSSCANYEGPRACHIVEGDIDPAGICKRWVIPEMLLNIQPDVQDSAVQPMDGTMSADPALVRYTAVEVEHRRIGGRDVEFRTVEVDGLQLRAVEADAEMPMRFAGYAAVFNSPSEPLPFTETIAPGAFRRSLNSGSEKRMFLNHNTDQVLASSRSGTLTLSEDQRGLYVEADLPDTTYGRDLSVLMQRGDVHSMSFGFSVPRGGDAWSEDGATRELREVILHEVSVVTGFPAYPATEGAQVRSTDEITDEATAKTESGLPVDLARRMLDLNAKR